MTPEQIKQARIKAGKSQTELAKLLGVSVVTISRWENGRAKPQCLLHRQALEKLITREEQN